MRRALYSLMAAGLFGLLSGCCHTRGVCDCEYDDHCYTRQPWIHHPGLGVAAPAMPIPIHAGEPAPLPKTKETPKELPPVRD